MSSASLSPTARAIQRWTVAVCRRTNAPNASSSPPRAEARSSSSVLSGSVKGESRRAAGAGAILRRIRAGLALAVRVRRVCVLESTGAVAGEELVLARDDAEADELGPELVADRDARGGRRVLVEGRPLHAERRL